MQWPQIRLLTFQQLGRRLGGRVVAEMIVACVSLGKVAVRMSRNFHAAAAVAIVSRSGQRQELVAQSCQPGLLLLRQRLDVLGLDSSSNAMITLPACLPSDCCGRLSGRPFSNPVSR